jgi:galactokinase
MSHEQALQQQLQRAAQRFAQRFGRTPRFAAVAPGRVNLIGEHTDYNDGFVMPMAIQMQTLIVADRAAGSQVTLVSDAAPNADQREARFSADAALGPGAPAWSNYVKGVVKAGIDQGLNPGGFDAVIDSTVPVGGGLSSSAALEVSTATLVEALSGRSLDPVAKALLCQWAEHHFAKVPCGIMDQFISVMGQAGHAMLLDCRAMKPRMVPLRDPAVSVLIINSHVEHELAGGEYAKRRAQCATAAGALGVKALRDANPVLLQQHRDRLDDVTFRRARHVISENDRAVRFADLLSAGDWRAAGELMKQSHESLRRDYEVSCEELDLLVDLACDAARRDDVFGSRMTGGGFGGCTVTLLRSASVERVSRDITDAYRQRTGITASVYVTQPAQGARALTL